jgi:integrase
VEEYLTVYALFKRILGDKPIARYDHDDSVLYIEALQKLPANMNKKSAYIGKSIEEIIALNPTPMSISTVNKQIERVSSLFKWAMGKPKYSVTHNPFIGSAIAVKVNNERLPFTEGELVQLFSSREFSTKQFEKPYAYWLPLLGLFTSARLNELCQLHLKDIVEIDGIACIDIDDEEEDQRLKNKSAKRLVPIHDKLIEVGLLRYVDKLRAQGESRLFPELSHNRDGYSGIASKWFGRYKTRCGIKEKHTKVFHSFRRTFISNLLNDEVPEMSVAKIVGHEGKLVTSKVYWNVKDPGKRKSTVDRFQVSPDIVDLIPVFDDVQTAARSGPR